MIAHLRTYTLNAGMLDSWLDLFERELVPRMEAAGITVHSRWVNAERTQFIWIRVYGETEAELETREQAFYGSDWWQANVGHVRSHLAHREVTVIHSV